MKKIGPVSLTPNDWIICGVCIVALGATILMLKLTRLGTSMRAVADNKDLAESSGIDVNSVIGKVWMLGGALAGLGGILYGLSYYVQFSIGFTCSCRCSPPSSSVASARPPAPWSARSSSGSSKRPAACSGSTPTTSSPPPSSVLILVLLVRPQGLLGSKERIG